jgi:hypothetical protein
MKELGVLIGLGIWIELASDMLIFHHPYRYSDMERDLIQSRMLDLLEAGLVQLSHGEYASTTVMHAKKDVHGNYIDRRMCGNYRLINRQTKSDKYAMPTPKEIFDVMGHRGFPVHLIFEQGTINCRFERRTRPRLHFGASTLTAKIICINGNSYPLG